MTAKQICSLCLCWHSPHCRATPPDTRWPLAPLIDAVGGPARLAALVDDGNITRARRDGLTDRQADHWATRCGLHPDEVWPGWCAAALRFVDQAAIEGSRAAWLHRETAA